MSSVDSKHPDLFSNLDDLHAIEADCWKLLATAPQDRDCGWRLPALATGGPAVPRQRTVVLRHVDPKSRKIFIHTDVRSPKIDSIRANPTVSWLFYDAPRHVQVQLVGQATILTSPAETEWMWQQEPESSLRGYLAPYAPGTTSARRESNLPPVFQAKVPDRVELEQARVNFAVICSTTATMEVLLLRQSGNIRSVFSYTQEVMASAEWLAP